MTAQRALVVSYSVPQPLHHSGGRRLDDLVCFLQEDGWEVEVVAWYGIQEHADDVARLRRRGVVVHDDAPGDQPDGSAVPGTAVTTLLEHVRFDLVLVAFWPTAEYYLPLLRALAAGTPVVVDSVDLHFMRECRRSAGAWSPDHGGPPLEGYLGGDLVDELNVYAAADAVLTVSAKERDLLHDLLGDRVMARVVPDCEVADPAPLPMESRAGVLFLGSYRHPPNVEALEFFCGHILPLLDPAILDRHPVYIVGDALDERLRGLAAGHPAVRMVGWVPELAPYFHRVRASVVPLLHGAGTKRKMVQALMHGTPTVSTDIGIEGLGLVDGEHVLVANDAPAIARAIERLLTDDALAERLARAGLEHVQDLHGRSQAAAALRAVVAEVRARPVKPALLPACGLERNRGRLRRRRRTPADPAAPTGGGAGDEVRLIALHLPQFHPIPENDAWWGQGFTEWRNVGRAQPLFDDHHQPQLPTDLGFYDLRLPEARAAQAELARAHGIHGFCHYHYWFQGKRLLERPVDAILASGEPDFPFCLCWANEPWSRRWDGSESEVLQPQAYAPADDLAHIRWLVGPLSDRRAIRVAGRPLFLVYRADQLPDARATTDLWRREAERAGLPGLYLVAVETGWDAGWDATRVGFDAKLLFQPQFSLLATVPRLDVGPARTRVFAYDAAWPVLADPPPVAYPRFDMVFPGWDNSPRRGADAWVLHGNTPESYEQWLRLAVRRAGTRPAGERLVFINAWNEWAEGAHLEPDRRHGRGFLEATRRVVEESRSARR